MGPGYERLRGLMRELDLHTVCEEARCPNVGECWNRGTATFMILGDVCTRACGFCAVKTGCPAGPPTPRSRAGWPRRWPAWACATPSSPRSTATTSATAAPSIFAACIREIRARVPGCAVEVLIPDFKGDWAALEIVLEARPDILNHNTETVPRLYRQVRPGARFERSLELLRRSKQAGLLTKSGIMVGLGEEWAEVAGDASGAIRDAGHRRPHRRPVPPPEPRSTCPSCATTRPRSSRSSATFALGLGYGHVESGPLVRSSYHADEQVPRT